jgi:hypothetical protein
VNATVGAPEVVEFSWFFDNAPDPLILESGPVYTCSFRSFLMIAGQDYDPLAPQKEAAMFYGLFLRGHSLEALRRDIDVPKDLIEKWRHAPRYEPSFRDNLRRVYTYRKQVLAIFEELVHNERRRLRFQ